MVWVFVQRSSLGALLGKTAAMGLQFSHLADALNPERLSKDISGEFIPPLWSQNREKL